MFLDKMRLHRMFAVLRFAMRCFTLPSFALLSFSWRGCALTALLWTPAPRSLDAAKRGVIAVNISVPPRIQLPILTHPNLPDAWPSWLAHSLEKRSIEGIAVREVRLQVVHHLKVAHEHRLHFACRRGH